MEINRKARIAGSVVLMALASLGFAASATADHHLIKIREFYPGLAATANDSFLELQMYAAGQNMTGGHHIQIYPGGSGGPDPNFTLTPTVNPPNAESQRTILIGGSSGPVSRDYTENLDGSTSFSPAGGALCFVSATGFGNVDCVEWGSGNDNVAGSAVAPGGIPDGMSVERSIAPGCPTLLEAGDDTDNSATDFFLTAPSPRNNATIPTETPCVSPTFPATTPGTTTPFNLKAAIRKCKKKFPKGPKRKKCIKRAKRKAATA